MYSCWIKNRLVILVIYLNIIYLFIFLLNYFLYIKFILTREIIGFFIFAFIPGLLILQILRIRNLPYYDTVVYSVGLSLTYEMILGLFINFLYPIFGINKPLSTLPVVLSILGSIFILCVLCYIRNKDNISYNNNVDYCTDNNEQISWGNVRSFGYFLLTPFLSIFGSYLFNYYSENAILLVMLAVISIIPGLVIFDKIDVELYPIVIWTISLSLAFYGTLNYPNLFFDTGWEYYLAEIVKNNGFWNLEFPPVRNNSMLYSVLLHPLLSMFCNIDLFYTYKIINPILFSLAPLVAYSIFNKQTNNKKISFISTILISFMFTFYIWFAPNTRQGGGFLFLALIILTIFDKSLNRINKKIFLLIFTFSLIVSHYGTSYLFIYLLIGIFITFYIWKSIFINRPVTANYIVLFIVSTLSYYLYTSGSAPLHAAFKFLKDMLNIVRCGVITQNSILVRSYAYEWPLSVRVSRDLILLTFIFILAGLIDQVLKKYRYNSNVTFSDGYMALAILTLLVYPIVSVNPDFGRGRTIVLGYLFLAPFFYIGFKKFWSLFINIIRFKSKYNRNYKMLLNVFLVVYLIIYLLFPSGFISETVTYGHDYSPAVFINKNYIYKIKNSNCIVDPYFLRAFYRIYARYDELASGQWLSKYWNSKSRVYVERSGMIGELTLVPYMYLDKDGNEPFVRIIMTKFTVSKNSYIYLRYFNYVLGITFKDVPTKYYIVNRSLLYNKNKIYDNGGSAIFYT